MDFINPSTPSSYALRQAFTPQKGVQKVLVLSVRSWCRALMGLWNPPKFVSVCHCYKLYCSKLMWLGVRHWIVATIQIWTTIKWWFGFRRQNPILIKWRFWNPTIFYLNAFSIKSIHFQCFFWLKDRKSSSKCHLNYQKW